MTTTIFFFLMNIAITDNQKLNLGKFRISLQLDNTILNTKRDWKRYQLVSQATEFGAAGQPQNQVETKAFLGLIWKSLSYLNETHFSHIWSICLWNNLIIYILQRLILQTQIKITKSLSLEENLIPKSIKRKPIIKPNKEGNF